MSGRRLLGWVALMAAVTSSGCCYFCERWCGTPPPVPCYQPCVPVCCPPPVCCPAPSHYQPQPASWSQPRATPGNNASP